MKLLVGSNCEFRLPRVLSCSHVYCDNCINVSIYSSSKAIVKCTVCEVTNLSYSNKIKIFSLVY